MYTTLKYAVCTYVFLVCVHTGDSSSAQNLNSELDGIRVVEGPLKEPVYCAQFVIGSVDN